MASGLSDAGPGGAAADLLPSITDPSGSGSVISEGPRWEIVVSPGVIRVRTRDYARAERTDERQLRHHQADVDIAAAYLANGEEAPEPLPTRGTIYAWSAKSRARLVARLSDLDYTRLYGRYRICSSCSTVHSDQLDHCPSCLSPTARPVDRTGRLPAMLTLTYPGDWLTVAPDAEAVKRHLTALCKRYERAWGKPLIGPWKLEFQRRGAPHFHISPTPPMGFATITDPETNEPRWADFRTWLSLAWAEIVDHPDPEQRRHRLAGTGVDYAEGIKLTDPRRMAIYFAKYGTSGGKGYQHQVPREWLHGCPGLRRLPQRVRRRPRRLPRLRLDRRRARRARQRHRPVPGLPRSPSRARRPPGHAGRWHPGWPHPAALVPGQATHQNRHR